MSFFNLEGSSIAEYLDPLLIASELGSMGAGAHELYGLPTSIFWKLLLSLKENSTSSLRDKSSVDITHGARRESKVPDQKEKDRKTLHITKTNDTHENQEKRKHTRRIRPMHSR